MSALETILPIGSGFENERARAAALIRHHPGNPGAADESRRKLKVMKAERLIAALTGSAPVLTIAQRAHLASLLLAEPSEDHGNSPS